jgi:hypothetical protein
MSKFVSTARTVALAAVLAVAGGSAFAKSGPLSQLRSSGPSGAADNARITPSAVVGLNVAGIPSRYGFGEAGNFVFNLQLAPNAEVTGIGWDVIVSAFDPSWLSEMVVSFENSDQSAGVFLTVGAGDDNPGLNAAYSSGGIVDLVGLSLNFNVGADGILRVEFFEDFDDSSVDPDGIWVSGSLNIDVATPIPEPGTYGLMALGALGVLAAVRRRKAV